MLLQAIRLVENMVKMEFIPLFIPRFDHQISFLDRFLLTYFLGFNVFKFIEISNQRLKMINE